MSRASYLALAILMGAGAFIRTAEADTFGSGANAFDIEFVTIGNPGNPPDTTDRPVTDGAVSYEYRIGKYEISEQMIDKANAIGGLGITRDSRGADMPASSISWFEAARFVNLLNTNAGSAPAYKFDGGGNYQLWQPSDTGYDSTNLYRNRLATYFLPTLSEWHKAAYYDPVAGVYYDYPTGSNTIPDGTDFPDDPFFDALFNDGGSNGGPNQVTDVGLLSPYGTAGQGGNIAEWLESAFDRINNIPIEDREMRGGDWGTSYTVLAASNDGIGWLPSFQGNFVGLRIVSIVPEPSTFVPSAAILFYVFGFKTTRRMF